MIFKAACLVSLLAAQDPGTTTRPPAASDLITGIEALPQGTLAVLSVGPLDAHLPEIRNTGLFQILSDLPLPVDLGSTLAKVRAEMSAETGLPDKTLARFLSRGLSIAVTRIDEHGQPGVLLTVPLGDDADDYVRAARQLQESGKFGTAQVRAEMWHDVPILTMDEPSGVSFSVCVSNGYLIGSHLPSEIERCLERLDSSAASLRDDPAYTEFAAHLTGEPAPMVSAFVQPAGLLQATLPQMRFPDADKVRAVIKGLQLNSIRSVGYTAHARGGRFHDVVRVQFPSPRKGLIGALLGPGLSIDASLSEMIPEDVSSFAVTHVQLDRVFEEVIGLMRSVDPSAPRMVTSALDSVRQRTGVDIEQDLLGLLGAQIVSLTWSPEDTLRPHMAFVIDVRDSWRIEQAMTRLLRSLRVPMTDDTFGTQKIHQIALPTAAMPVDPSFALTGKHLVIATSDLAMQGTLTQLAGGGKSPRAETFFAALPAGSTWAGWSDFGVTASAMLDQFESAAPAGAPMEMLESIRLALGRFNGSMETSMSMDDDGVTIRSRSPVGNLWMIGGAGVVSSIALPNLIKAKMHADRMARERQGQRGTKSQGTPTRTSTTQGSRQETPPAAAPLLEAQQPRELRTDRQRYEAIVAAETQKASRVPVVVLDGLESANVKVVRRAAHAAGVLRAVEGVPQLCKLTEHEDTEVCVQAMAALSRIGDARSLRAALAGLQADDERIRLFAIATLGRLRDPAGADALMLHLDSERATDTERVQTTLALADLGDPESLMRASTIISTDGEALDQALAFMFQSLSPKLASEDEAKVLMAVLGHDSQILRRYAIQRLGQLRSPAAQIALEGRLGQENDSLRPLIMVSLDAIRGKGNDSGKTWDKVRETASTTFAKAKAWVRPWIGKAKDKWKGLSRNEQYAVGGGGAGIFVVFIGLLVWRSKRKRRHRAEAATSSYAPAGASEWDTGEYTDQEPGMDVEEAPWVDEEPYSYEEEAEYDESTEQYTGR